MNYRRVTRLITAVLIIACLAGISGCKRTYDLAIGVEGIGTVQPAAGIHQYERDLPVTLKAVPAQGWGFTGWGGPHGKTVVDNTIIMDQNKYITAIFQKLQHQLDISVEPAGAGIVEVAIVPASKAAPIADGQTVRLTAVPNNGFVFGCWDDDPESSSPTFEFLMDSPKTIKAVFIAEVAAPEFTPDQGTYNYAQEVALTCETPGAEIRYTTDGITVPSATEGTLYDGTPIQVTKTTVIKAIAYKPGMTNSAVVTRVYTIEKLQFPLNITIEPVGAGTVEVAIVPASKAVPIEDGQTVRLTAVPKTGYVFGCWNDDPESSNATLEFLMDAPKTIKAAFIAVVAAPEFTPAQGTYNYAQEVALTCATPGAQIRYTTDGITVPSATEGTLYNDAPLQLTQSAVIKAIAYKPGLVDSAVVTRVYTIKAPTPVADLADGDYFGSQTVTLSTTPANLTIRYTLDGSEPTATHGIIYHGPITIDKTMTLKAVAYTVNLAVSNVLTRNYSVYSLSTVAPMPTPRKGLAAAAIGGKAYAIGGMNSTGILSTVEAYDPVTNTWETKASMPTARTYLAAAVMDGYIYAFGGRTDSAGWTKTVERYDPQTNTWESRVDAPRYLASCTAVPVNGVIHIVGGGYSSPGSETFFNGHLYYYPQADAWQEAPIPPRNDDNEHFRGNSAATVDRTIYYFGGAYATVRSSEYTRSYNTLWQSWSYGTNVPVRCQDAAAAAIGNRVFLIGGLYFSWGNIVNRYDAIRLYNPETNSWVSTFATMPTARYLHAAAVIGESIYIVGGESADGVLAADVIEFGLKR